MIRSILLAAAIAASSPSLAQDRVTVGEGIIATFEEPVWSGRPDGEWFVFENSTTPSAIRYTDFDLRDIGRTSISAEIRQEAGGDGSFAGLIFGLDQAVPSYDAFVFTPDGRIGLLRRREGGFDQPILGVPQNGIVDGTARLTARGVDGGVEYLLNGERILFSDQALEPVAGIIAIGTGRMAFRDIQFD